MNVYCLYFPNGKRYVGVESKTGTRINFHARGYGLRLKHPPLVSRAIHAHGWKSIHWRYLVKDVQKETGLLLERFFIKILEAQNPSIGYNISEGGAAGTLGVKHSDETKRKMSAARIGRPVSIETCDRIRKSLTGRKYSYERKTRAGMAHRGVRAWNKGAVGVMKPNSSSFRIGGTAPIKGRIMLPAGPNGEPRYFRPEQLI